jgi:hypothetical protein
MRKIIAFSFVAIAAIAISQNSVTAPVTPNSSTVVPQWNEGVVEGRTYKNASVGLPHCSETEFLDVDLSA